MVFFGKSISDLNTKLQAATASGSYAVKSFDIEFMESRNQFIVSIGYAEGQPGYPVNLIETVVGPIPEFGDTPEQLCGSMEAITAEYDEVISHELYVDNDEVVHLVLMNKS